MFLSAPFTLGLAGLSLAKILEGDFAEVVYAFSSDVQ